MRALLIASLLFLPAVASAQGIDEDKLLELIEDAAAAPQKKHRLEMAAITKNKKERLAAKQIAATLDRRTITVNFDEARRSFVDRQRGLRL